MSLKTIATQTRQSVCAFTRDAMWAFRVWRVRWKAERVIIAFTMKGYSQLEMINLLHTGVYKCEDVAHGWRTIPRKA